jgi:hypothetical protein
MTQFDLRISNVMEVRQQMKELIYIIAYLSVLIPVISVQLHPLQVYNHLINNRILLLVHQLLPLCPLGLSLFLFGSFGLDSVSETVDLLPVLLGHGLVLLCLLDVLIVFLLLC